MSAVSASLYLRDLLPDCKYVKYRLAEMRSDISISAQVCKFVLKEITARLAVKYRLQRRR